MLEVPPAGRRRSSCSCRRLCVNIPRGDLSYIHDARSQDAPLVQEACTSSELRCTHVRLDPCSGFGHGLVLGLGLRSGQALG